jgi:hypothetical protein
VRVRRALRAKPPVRKTVNQEETMRKSLILFVAAIGSGAGYAAGVTDVGKDLDTSDPATWRWHVSSILADQRQASTESVATIGTSVPGDFDQSYQRYSPLGSPEPRRERAP